VHWRPAKQQNHFSYLLLAIFEETVKKLSTHCFSRIAALGLLPISNLELI
jgi:hypothetical protein